MTDYRTSEPTPQDIERMLDELWAEIDDDTEYTWDRTTGQVQRIHLEDSDGAMAIVAYTIFAAGGFVMGMVFMRILTWVWA